MKYISRDYVALALIMAKRQVLYENFITIEELNEFERYLQNIFNEKGLNILVLFNSLNKNDFIIYNDVILKSDDCSINFSDAPIELISIFYDTNLFIDFYIRFEENILSNLHELKEENIKIYKRKMNN